MACHNPFPLSITVCYVLTLLLIMLYFPDETVSISPRQYSARDDDCMLATKTLCCKR
jgi:hypothetical protein